MKLLDIFRKMQPASPTAEELLIQGGMRERNEARIAAIKQEMGEKWILHPAHKKSRLDKPRPV